MSTYIAIVKLAYVPVVNADDEVIPGNIAALEKGLEARKKMRASDFVRERELWAEANALLAEESEDETGAAATGTVAVSDDFQMMAMSEGI